MYGFVKSVLAGALIVTLFAAAVVGGILSFKLASAWISVTFSYSRHLAMILHVTLWASVTGAFLGAWAWAHRNL